MKDEPLRLLYVGVLDDKALEYPFGLVDHIDKIAEGFLFNHCLFSEHPVLEEGFLLASDEALRCGKGSKILLSAVRAGLFKVASRSRDFVGYADERRGVGHATPPNTQEGRAYIHDLQSAAHGCGAFLHYAPPGDIDEVTFWRFAALLKGGEIEDYFHQTGSHMPADFLARFIDTYDRGNNGRRWTARAAWEATARAVFVDDPLAVHSLMCVANRERQIVRGASLAVANSCDSVEVETGLSERRHALADRDGTSGTIARHHGSILPRVSIDMLVRCHELLFEKLGDRGSPLSQAKKAYLEQLNRTSDPNFKGGAEDLQDAAAEYETRLYKDAKCTRSEDNFVFKAVASMGVASVVNPVMAIMEARAEARGVKLPPDRRKFMKYMVNGLAVTATIGTGALDPIISKTLRSGRLIDQFETGDTDAASVQPKAVAHERLTINRTAATKALSGGA